MLVLAFLVWKIVLLPSVPLSKSEVIRLAVPTQTIDSARQRINAASQDESIYLEPLQEVVQTGRTLSDELIAKFSGRWRGDIDHVFEEYAF